MTSAWSVPRRPLLFCESDIADPGHNQDDCNAWNGLSSVEPLFSTTRHNGGTFVDGHVAWRKYEQVRKMHFPDHQIVR